MGLHETLQFARAALAGGVFAIFLLEAFLYVRQRRTIHGYASALLLITTAVIVGRIVAHGATEPDVARNATRVVWGGLFVFGPLCTLSLRRIASMKPSACTRATAFIGAIGAILVWFDGPLFAAGHRTITEITGNEVIVVNIGPAAPFLLVPYFLAVIVDLINIVRTADFDVAPISFRALAFSLLLLVGGSVSEVLQIAGLYTFVGTVEFSLGIAMVVLLFVFTGYAARAIRALEQDVEDTNVALEGTVESLRGLISGLPDLVLVARSGEIEPYNDLARKMLGPDIVPVQSLGADTESAHVLGELVENASSTPTFARTTLTTLQGLEPVDIVAVAAEIDGERVVIANGRSTRERDQLERQLRLADRLSSLGTMAAGVAHEINNPIAYISANLEFCLTKLRQEEGRSEQVEALESAMRGTERVARIVRDLGTFARFDHDSPEHAGEVQHALDIALGIANSTLRHTVELQTDLSDDLPLVALDTGRLSQVMLNLLINASDAMPEGRERKQNFIAVSATRSAEGVSIVFSDNGSGMTEQQAEKAFDPFFTTKDVGEGTGLGLSICHSIIEQAGGSISVETSPGEGCTFEIRLPTATGAPEPADDTADDAADDAIGDMPGPAADDIGDAADDAAGEHAPDPPERARILLVDDDPLVLRSTERLLRSSHDVATAESADAALELLQENEVDFILCDVMMPDQNGLEFLERLAQSHPDLAHRLIYFTGGVIGSKIQNALTATGVPIITKPLDRAELDAALAELKIVQ